MTIAEPWQEVGDRVFVRRHVSLDLNCGLVIGTTRVWSSTPDYTAGRYPGLLGARWSQATEP